MTDTLKYYSVCLKHEDFVDDEGYLNTCQRYTKYVCCEEICEVLKNIIEDFAEEMKCSIDIVSVISVRTYVFQTFDRY